MIQIKRSVYEGIISHAKKELPIEACGYLAGNENTISHYYPMKNIDNSPEHFSFNPAEQFEVVKTVRNSGLTVIANYHSHPVTPARPSEEDIRLAFDPSIVYFIISLAGQEPVLKGFSIEDKRVNQVETVIVD